MALNKENLSKVLQTVSKKGVSAQPSEEGSGLKSKMRKRKKKKEEFKDEEISPPSNVAGSW
jgi:hypothetical protein